MPQIELSPLELAAGRVWGTVRPLPVLAISEDDPVHALESICAEALRRPPCLVSFSGGGDSSAVLALAARTARRLGLPLPVPATLRFPGVPAAQETEWQELVVAHLELEDWLRLDLADELDLLGDLATGVLRRHGLFWPANAPFHVPIFERAAGGSVLTGLDGDGLFGGWRWQAAQAVLTGRTRPSWRALRPVPLALAPAEIRARAMAIRHPARLEWLKEDAARSYRDAIARWATGEPRRWDARLAWYAGRRDIRAGLQILGALAADHDVAIHHPLAAPAFLGALAGAGGAAGLGSRLEINRRLFGDLLPHQLIERRTKADFTAAVWGPAARSFAADWNGRGIDPERVDAERLRRHWLGSSPLLYSATLLHRAWLCSTRSAPPAREHIPPARPATADG